MQRSLQRIGLRLGRASKRTGAALMGSVAVAAMRVTRMTDPDWAINTAARVARVVGPWLPEHEVGRANLKAAFPDKSPEQIETLLLGVWENLGRLVAEFAHIDRLWDANQSEYRQPRIESSPATRDRGERLQASKTPALFFTAHLGNWELPAVGAAATGTPSAALYRRPNIAAAADVIVKMRAVNMGILVPTGLGAPLTLARLLSEGTNVGMLVDQHDTKGVEIEFFGRRCLANPLLAMLARQIEVPIHGIHSIRLPGNRYRIELTDAVEPVRDLQGNVDVQGTTQRINTIIEGWVREYPEQWLWLHNRWRLDPQKKKRS